MDVLYLVMAIPAFKLALVFRKARHNLIRKRSL